jgi:G:T/U-mismatch repair DNA glycosylase
MLDIPAAACETLPQAVAAYTEAFRLGGGAAIADRAQPSTVVYALDGGKVVGQTRAAWKAQPAQPAPDLATEVVSAGPRTAIVTARWTQGYAARRDYTLWARLECRWRIMGRVVGAERTLEPSAAEGVRATVDLKLASDAAWDPVALAKAIEPRALVITIDDEQMAAASVADWQARYTARAKANYPSKQTVLARAEEGRGDLGAATWTFRSASGATYADRALLLRTPEGWRMLALLWVRED